MAANIGLSKSQTDALEYLVVACKVKQPFLIFSNAGLLDDVLRRGINSIGNDREKSQEERDRKQAELFKTKEIIERSYKRGVGITSTSLIRPGQSLVFVQENGKKYQSRLIANFQKMLACTAPVDEDGQVTKLERGTRLKAHFWRVNDSSYMFLTKVLRYDALKGQQIVVIQHSKALKRSQHRRFRRRELVRSCFFYPIEIIAEGRGRRARKRAFVQQNFRHLGTLLDVSAGGCSISSQTPIEKGRLIMVEFEINRGTRITSYGKVIGTGKKAVLTSTMHVMFTKVTRHNLNHIYTYVYNYVKPDARELRRKLMQRSG
jgi:hypothetical protein